MSRKKSKKSNTTSLSSTKSANTQKKEQKASSPASQAPIIEKKDSNSSPSQSQNAQKKEQKASSPASQAPVIQKKDSSSSPSQSQNAQKKVEHCNAPVKHPLQDAWTLWYFRNDRSKSWEQNLKEVITVDTVEDFWGVYHHITQASHLDSGCDYSFFKKGIKPMWEDPRNARGGRWLINLEVSHRGQYLDKTWLEVLFCLIGDSFGPDGALVNGAVIQVRNRGDKLAIWLGNVSDEAAIMRVGRLLKERLQMGSRACLAFEAHQDNMRKTGSMARSKFLL